MKKLFLIAVLNFCSFAVFSPVIVFAQEQEIFPAPFGLKWGMTKQEIEKNNVVLKQEEKNEFFITYSASSLPKNLSDYDSYWILISDHYGLVKVVYYSNSITGDVYGTEGKEKYNELKQKLTDKYGIVKSYEYIGRKLYDESDEFYQCLRYDGCGNYISFFNISKDNTIVLTLKGTKRGVGYIRLNYESALFRKAKQEESVNINKADDDAL